jgi:hypothetical protein
MKKEQSILGLIRKHYIITIIFPFVINFNYLMSQTWSIDDDNSVISQIFFYINKGIFLLLGLNFLFYLFKGKWKLSFTVLVVPFLTTLFLAMFLDEHEINRDNIYYRINKKEISKMIEKEDSIAQDGKGRLVKIPMNGAYLGCDKYLVYDEIDEMKNSKGNFRGIDYVNINNDILGYSYHKKAFKVLSYYVDKHIYIMYFCLDTGQ